MGLDRRFQTVGYSTWMRCGGRALTKPPLQFLCTGLAFLLLLLRPPLVGLALRPHRLVKHRPCIAPLVSTYIAHRNWERALRLGLLQEIWQSFGAARTSTVGESRKHCVGRGWNASEKWFWSSSLSAKRAHASQNARNTTRTVKKERT